jgi:hypothetical protein
LLEKIQPGYKKDIVGDLGIVKAGYEVWKTIMLFDYDQIALDAVSTTD